VASAGGELGRHAGGDVEMRNVVDPYLNAVLVAPLLGELVVPGVVRGDEMAPLEDAKRRPFYLRRSLTRYIAALIEYQRLTLIEDERSNTHDGPATSNDGAVVLSQTGFYPLEQYQGQVFRWSETEAAVRFRARPGDLSIRVKCLPVRSLSDRINLRFYLDGKPVPNRAISYEAGGFEIQLVVPQSGTATLGWLCRAFPAPGILVED